MEIRALLLDAGGSNLRNDLAHGLTGDADAGTHIGACVCWICLRLAMLSYFGRVRDDEDQSGERVDHESRAGNHSQRQDPHGSACVDRSQRCPITLAMFRFNV